MGASWVSTGRVRLPCSRKGTQGHALLPGGWVESLLLITHKNYSSAMKLACKSLSLPLIRGNVGEAPVFTKGATGPPQGLGAQSFFLSQVLPSRDTSAPQPAAISMSLGHQSHPRTPLLISQARFISVTKSINHPTLAIKQVKRLNEV